MGSGGNSKDEKLKDLEVLFNQGNMQIVIPEAIKLIKHYKSGLAVNILALAYKKLGDYAKALNIYEKLLIQNPDNDLFLNNLGNIYSEIGKFKKAEECFKKCLDVQPANVNASISLGKLYLAKSKYNEALAIFKSILATNTNLNADHLANINYRIAEIYRSKGIAYSDQAIQYYSQSNRPLSNAHRLELIYRTKDRATFCLAEEKINISGDLNPLLAAVQTHASIRYEKPDKNLFCKNPFDYIKHSKIKSSEGFDDDLVEKLLEVKNTLDMTPQALLRNGEQSAGNFLVSNEPSIQIIKNIIIRKIEEYRTEYASSCEGFIRKWPEDMNLHGWIIDIKKGGNLASHMHKLGWLSGSVYLRLKKPLYSSQGNIVFTLHGADYPEESKVFPSRELNIEKGDIVLFPSSIFHKTIPFESDESRITLAFDLKPLS